MTLEAGKLYRTLFLAQGDVYDINGELRGHDSLEMKIVLMLEPNTDPPNKNVSKSYSKILANNNTFYILTSLLRSFELPKSYETNKH